MKDQKIIVEHTIQKGWFLKLLNYVALAVITCLVVGLAATLLVTVL